MSSLNSYPEGRSAPAATACFSVSAAADPSVMPRVIQLFAKRGLVPSQWHSQVVAGGELQIDLQMDGMDAADAERYAQSMRQIVCVERVLTSFKQAADRAG